MDMNLMILRYHTNISLISNEKWKVPVSVVNEPSRDECMGASASFGWMVLSDGTPKATHCEHTTTLKTEEMKSTL